jgi:hypothetical protein
MVAALIGLRLPDFAMKLVTGSPSPRQTTGIEIDMTPKKK